MKNVRIAVLLPGRSGGVPIITRKLISGLIYEGLSVRLIEITGRGIVDFFLNDLKIIKTLNDFDVIFYTRSLAYTSSIVFYGKPIGLFIHGLIPHECKSALLYGNMRTILRALFAYSWWKTVNMNLFKPDFYICHSKSSCKANMIPENKCVILPQFVLPREVEWFKEFRKKINERSSFLNKMSPTLVAYTSFADSPRLLSYSTLMYVAKRLGERLNRKTVFYIIQPKLSREFSYKFNNVKVIVRGFMPRVDFLKLLASSDLYIETCVDEEIGLDSIEAGLLKVPLAKVTHSEFVEFQDYSRDEVIVENNLKDFIDSLYEYITNIEQYKDFYGNNFHNFLLKKRLWSHVKTPLISKLYSLIQK